MSYSATNQYLNHEDHIFRRAGASEAQNDRKGSREIHFAHFNINLFICELSDFVASLFHDAFVTNNDQFI